MGLNATRLVFTSLLLLSVEIQNVLQLVSQSTSEKENRVIENKQNGEIAEEAFALEHILSYYHSKSDVRC